MWLRGPPPQQSADLEQLQPMQNQNAMLDACEAGDVTKLQQLLKAAGVKHGDNEFEPFYGEPVPATGPPPTSTMITAAVAHKQPSVVSLLLSVYRNVHLDRDSIWEAALSQPDLPTLEVLHSHTPTIVNYAFRETHRTLLMQACRSSDPFLPMCLLRLGADPSECDLSGTGPLYYAVTYSQPFDVIVKLVEHGAVATDRVIQAAMPHRDLECLKFLLDRARLEDPKLLLRQAQDTNNKAVASLVWDRTTYGKKSPLKRRKKKGTSTFVFEPRAETTKWWQVGR